MAEKSYMTSLRWDRIVGQGEAFHINSLQCTRSRSLEVHDHLDFAELFLVERGEGIHIVNGRELPLVEGNLVLLRPTDAHGFRTKAMEGFRYVNLAFPRSTLAFIGERYYEGDQRFWGGKEPLPAACVLDMPRRSRLLEGLHELSRAPRLRIRVEAFLLGLCAELYAPENQEEGPVGISTLPPWLSRALKELERPENLHRGLSAFFELAGRSPEHVARECKRRLGRTPTEIVNERRLAKAVWLLDMSDEDALSIAYDCGFESPSYFYRLFRERYGESPRQYRLARKRLVAPGSA